MIISSVASCMCSLVSVCFSLVSVCFCCARTLLSFLHVHFVVDDVLQILHAVELHTTLLSIHLSMMDCCS